MTGALAAAGSGGAIDYPDFVSETINGGGSPAYYTMKSAGSLLNTNNTTGSLKWVRNTSPSNYEVFATVTSGSLSSGTTGSWLAFTGSDYTWQKTSGISCVVQLQLRDKYSLTVVKTVSVTLQP